MPISMNKLSTMLLDRGFLIRNIFITSDSESEMFVSHLEIINIASADTFIVYIPSKYDIPMTEEGNNVYKLSYIKNEDIGNDEENPSSTIAIQPETNDLEDIYDDVLQNIKNDKNIYSTMEQNYNKPITIKDKSQKYKEYVRNIYRQLTRLKYAVQNIDYKLTIIYSDFFCTIKRDNSIECYKITNYPISTYRIMYVTPDIEMIYSNNNSIIEDILNIREEIYRILEKNERKHIHTLEQIKDDLDQLSNLSENRLESLESYNNNISRFESILNSLVESESTINIQINNIKKNSNSLTSLHNDISNSHKIGKLENDLLKIQYTKSETVNTLLELKYARDNILLVHDKILFDNIVMLNQVILNNQELNLL